MSRKRKKEDRAKTQLKKPKTAPGKFLPKGTNETKTEFKVTKIVIPGQNINGGASSSDGPTTSKNIGIKDVLHKLTHFSQAVRTDGLDGLKELLSSAAAPGLVQTNLSKIVTTLVTLVQDREKKIRKQTVSLLGMSLGHVTSSLVTPLYPLMSAHVSCCLTNIDPRIQQDGLTLLDTLIDKAPEFVEQHHSSLIPNCLDQISNKKASGSKGPNVAANVSESLTALQWRLAVMTRVNRILDLAIEGRKTERQTDVDVAKEQIFKPNNFYPLVGKGSLQHFPLSNLTEGQSNTSIADNIHLLMPLLIETWVEARASDSKSTKSSNLSSDSCDLLLNIAGIMDKLLVIASETFDVTEGAKVLSEVKSKFWNDIRQHFISYLPYRSPNTNVDKSSALLCCVNVAIDQDISSQLSEVAVKMCASKHVSVELKIRIAKVLLDKAKLSNELRENLMSSLTSLSQKTDNKLEKQSLLNILKKEAELSPDENATKFWLENLPDQIVNCDEEEKQELLNVCLHLVQRNNKSLANKLLQSWDNLTSCLIQCQDNEKMKKTLGFVEYYCKLLKV